MSLREATALLFLWRPRLTRSAVLACIFMYCLCPIFCEEECLKSKVWCYECESTKDPYCNDPFNASIEVDSMRVCEGCCVKVVREKNKPTENIWRTCTSKLQINLFMVDHVCMEESGSQGHMCFCETDGCNGGPSRVRPQAPLVLLPVLLSATFSLFRWPWWVTHRLTHCKPSLTTLASLLLGVSIASSCAFLCS